MNKIWFIAISLLASIATIIFLPSLAIAVLAINALFAAIIAFLQITATLIKPKRTIVVPHTKEFFVSIHVPCHYEPFVVMEKTLSRLAKLDYHNYEVIVIDNNTHDPKIWQPIQEYCKKLGPRFKFLHFEHLDGYKAGALNAALRHIDPRTEIIAIIDADYVVHEDFLKRGVPYFNNPSTAIVQFPQAYYNTNPKTIGLEREYRSFFDNILEHANSWNAVTVTGTLSLLRAKLFPSNHLTWNEWCITEDTEIGMHFHGMGYRSIFINDTLGQGLMPFNYFSLQRQRERWVHGNMQILRKDLLPVLKNRCMDWKQKVSYLTQLLAWFHPNFFPFIFLAPFLVIASISEQVAQFSSIGWVSILTIIGFIFAKMLIFLLGQLRRKTLSLTSLAATLLTHFGLSGTMSLTWLWALTTPRLPFNRTTKDASEKIMPYIPTDSILASLLLGSGIVSVVLAPSEATRVAAILGISLACFVVFSIWFAARQTKAAKHIAHKLMTISNSDQKPHTDKVSLHGLPPLPVGG